MTPCGPLKVSRRFGGTSPPFPESKNRPSRKQELLSPCWFFASVFLRLRIWRRHVPVKRQLALKGTHDIFQKNELFRTAPVIISNTSLESTQIHHENPKNFDYYFFLLFKWYTYHPPPPSFVYHFFLLGVWFLKLYSLQLTFTFYMESHPSPVTILRAGSTGGIFPCTIVPNDSGDHHDSCDLGLVAQSIHADIGPHITLVLTRKMRFIIYWV
jgi:hypothetical protein